MNNRYRISKKDNHHFSYINAELRDSWINYIGFAYYNLTLQQYGLLYIDEHIDVYEVIDETLFGLFLLEYSDEIKIREFKS